MGNFVLQYLQSADSFLFLFNELIHLFSKNVMENIYFAVLNFIHQREK